MLKKKLVNITIVSLAAIVLFGALLHGVAAVGPPYAGASGTTNFGSPCGSGQIITYSSNGQITANWSCGPSSGSESGSGWIENFWTTTATTDWYVTTSINFASMSLQMAWNGHATWSMNFLVVDQSTGQTVLNQQFYSCSVSGGSTNCAQGQTISYQSSTFFASAQHRILYEIVVSAYADNGIQPGTNSVNLFVNNMSAGAFSSPCHRPAPTLSSPSIAPSPNC